MARIERLIHLLMREKLGGVKPPDLSARIMNSIDAETAPARPVAPVRQLPPPSAFRPWMAVAASIAIVAAVALGVSAFLLAGDPKKSPTPMAGGSNKPVVIPSQQDRANSESPGKPEPRPEPQPKPEPQVPDQVEQPAPQSEPTPAPTPEQPKPDKDPVVNEPAPPEPAPEPAPEPPKPDKDPVVEEPTNPTPQPQPERPPTEPRKDPVVELGTVLYAADKSKLTYRMNSDEKWQDWVASAPVLSGMQLKTRKPVCVEFADGARFYFDGEIALTGTEKSLDVSLVDESVYFDVYGSKREFSVRRGDAVLKFADAELLAEKSGLRMAVACLGGELTIGDVTLKAGWTASVSDSGFSRQKFEGERVRNNALVSSMDRAFVLMREELNADAAKRVYCGEWKDGIVTGGSPETAFGIEFANEIEVKDRAYVRMRIRVHGSKDGLSIGFSSDKESDWRYFQSHHKDVPNDEWVIVRVPLRMLQDDGAKKGIWPGVKLHKFQIVLWTKEGSSVDVDWFELGVDPDWNTKESK